MLHTLTLLLLPFLLRGQSTVAFTKVYAIFQSKCVNCHSNGQKEGGLDLEGSGTDKSGVVFNNLVNKPPINLAANSKGHKLVYPGRIDKSFLFHKINAGFDTYYPALSANEGLSMPQSGTVLTKTEKEIIRQWVLYGANKTAKIPEDRIRAYYDTVGRGIAAFETPPAPPTKGFQIRMGPFFLAPNGTAGNELEYYQKWELSMANDVEVNRLDHLISPSSHHLIIYYFANASSATSIPAGLRTDAYHAGISLVSAVQEKTDLFLPDKTAFKWEKNRILDLNSHYINYSANHVYKADAYINVHTQANGTAKQEMYSILVPNTNISIPNTGQTITQEAPFIYTGKIYLWGILGHTHKYGTGYKIFKRLPNGVKGELLYDASCPNGIPGCASPYFDYKHIPVCYFQPFKAVDLNPGIIHQATWKNDGPKSLSFGPTSEDEMMVMSALYTLDTLGLTSSNEARTLEEVKVFPNPMSEHLTVILPPSVSKAKIVFYDLLGREIKRKDDIETHTVHIERENLKRGMYIYKIEDQRGYIKTGKIWVE